MRRILESVRGTPPVPVSRRRPGVGRIGLPASAPPFGEHQIKTSGRVGKGEGGETWGSQATKTSPTRATDPGRTFHRLDISARRCWPDQVGCCPFSSAMTRYSPRWAVKGDQESRRTGTAKGEKFGVSEGPRRARADGRSSCLRETHRHELSEWRRGMAERGVREGYATHGKVQCLGRVSSWKWARPSLFCES